MRGVNYEHFMRMAYRIATLSPDPSTQNGAVIVSPSGVILGTGCNTFPRGVAALNERLERPLKYKMIEHAERSAIFNAVGRLVYGSTMICPWAACSDCARAIIGSGITTLVVHEKLAQQERVSQGIQWDADIAVAMEMLDEAGVKVEYLKGDLGGPIVLHSGELFVP